MKVRNILSVIVGVAIGAMIIFLGENVIEHLNPLPLGLDLHNPETLKNYIANAPASMHLMLLISYALGCFTGGLVAAGIASDKKMTKAMTLGGLFMGIGMFNLIALSHPVWVIIASVFAFLPFAYLGGIIGIKISPKKK